MNTTGNYTTNQGHLTLEQVGEKVNGKYSKTGVLEGIISGNVITGTWKNENYEGLFEFEFLNDGSFNGKYKNGLDAGTMRGKWNGTLEKEDGINTSQQLNEIKNYEGELTDGKKHGNGKWIDEENDIWDGLWNNNVFVKGKIIFQDGSMNEGEFKDDELNGEGKNTYKDDDGELVIEQGIFKEGVLIKGSITYQDESKQEGEFNEEGLNGKGKWSYKDDDDELVVEEGEFIDGILIKGTINWENGSKSEGEFNEEGLNGEGIRTFNDGSFEKGTFKDGDFIEGTCKKLNEDNLIYQEKWLNGKPVNIISPDLKDEKNMLFIGENIIKNGKSNVIDALKKKYTHFNSENEIYNLSKPEIAKLLDLMLDACLAFYELKNPIKVIPESKSIEEKKLTQKPVENKNESVLQNKIIYSQQETKRETASKKIKYDNGIYIGAIDPVTKNRHGYGAYIWNDGNYYEGDFLQNKRTGKGIYIWPDGRYYVGDFIDGKRTGIGKEWNREKRRYATGKFVDGKPEKPYIQNSDYAEKNLSSDLSVFFKTQSKGFDFLKIIASQILEKMPKINCENSNDILKNISCDIKCVIPFYIKENHKYFGSSSNYNLEITQPGVKINLESIFSNTAPGMINEITQTEFNKSILNDINSQLNTSKRFFTESLQKIIDEKSDLPHIEIRQGDKVFDNLLNTHGYHPIVVEDLFYYPVSSDQIREDIRVIFMGLDLIEQSIKKRSVHDKETYWKLTEKGNKMMVDIKMKKLM